jgi:hypothetical protein
MFLKSLILSSKLIFQICRSKTAEKKVSNTFFRLETEAKEFKNIFPIKSLNVSETKAADKITQGAAEAECLRSVSGSFCSLSFTCFGGSQAFFGKVVNSFFCF